MFDYMMKTDANIKEWGHENQENTWVIGKMMVAIKYSSIRQLNGLQSLIHEKSYVKRRHLT